MHQVAGFVPSCACYRDEFLRSQRVVVQIPNRDTVPTGQQFTVVGVLGLRPNADPCTANGRTYGNSGGIVRVCNRNRLTGGERRVFSGTVTIDQANRRIRLQKDPRVVWRDAFAASDELPKFAKTIEPMVDHRAKECRREKHVGDRVLLNESGDVVKRRCRLFLQNTAAAIQQRCPHFKC